MLEPVAIASSPSRDPDRIARPIPLAGIHVWERAWRAAERLDPSWPLVPVCMWCQRVAIRLDDHSDRWETLPFEARSRCRLEPVASHLTHGMCPECCEEHYPGLLDAA